MEKLYLQRSNLQGGVIEFKRKEADLLRIQKELRKHHINSEKIEQQLRGYRHIIANYQKRLDDDDLYWKHSFEAAK